MSIISKEGTIRRELADLAYRSKAGSSSQDTMVKILSLEGEQLEVGTVDTNANVRIITQDFSTR